MGHVGDIEHRYTTNKGRLPQQVIEDMRSAYDKNQEFLHTKVTELPKEDDLKRLFRSELLHMAGFTDDEMQEDGLLELTEDEFRKAIRSRLLPEKANNNTQKVVSMAEIEKYIENGWEFVTTLPNDRVVLKLQSDAD